MKKLLPFLVIILCLHSFSYAQVFNPWGPPPNHKDLKPNLIRQLLSHVSGEVALGYGSTRYLQNLDNYSLYSGNNQLLLLGQDSTGQSVGIGNWLNKPFVTDTFSTYNATPFELNSSNEFDPNGEYIIEDGKRRLRGGGSAIPISVKGTINWRRFRIGGGATFVLNTKAKLSLKGYPDYINSYESDFGTFFTQKYYFTAGYRYFDFWSTSYYVDLEYGSFKLSQNAFPASNVALSKYWNISLPIEKHLSKYFSLVLRPSLDLKSIQTAIPTGESIKTKMWNVQLQAGIRVSFPLYKKCPISNCEAQKEHLHVDKQFRGQPLYKIQNPKVGENHRKMDRGKRGFFSFLKPQ
jgi:hypothetical protein